MILRVTQQDADANNENGYFDALRQKNYEASFPGVEQFVRENKDRLRHRRQRKPVRRWQWVLAVLLPVLLVLACTKTERTEAVGDTISFTVPEKDDAAKREIESLLGGLQAVVAPDKQKPGQLSYTLFVPAQSTRSAGAVLGQLKTVKGVSGLSTMPVNAQVKETLLSQLGSKIFSTHVDATALSDAEVQSTLMRQLKEQGFTHISVTVGRDAKGVRTLQLHTAEGVSVQDDPNNYRIDVSMDDKGTRMVLQEEKRTTTTSSPSSDDPGVDFSRMTDAQVRDHMRSKFGKQLRDEDIKITRTAGEIAINIKQGEKIEEIMRFRLR